MLKQLLSGLAVAVALSLVMPASAAIIYVDATSTVNTYNTGDSLGDAVTGWNIRTGFANDDPAAKDVFEATGAAPEITTEVSLASSLYDVYVFFWDASNAPDLWTIDAGRTSGSLTRYTNDGTGDPSVLASTLTYDTAPSLFTEDNRTLYAAYLGQVTGSTIQVFVDSSATSSSDRVWYDGIGYAVVPEPASLALLTLGSLCILGRSRRS